jgi:transposase
MAEFSPYLKPAKKKRKSGYHVHKLSDEVRLLFVEDALGNGVLSACAKYDVPRSTGYQIMDSWDPSVGVESLLREKPGRKPGKAVKLTDDIKAFLNQKVESDPTLSGKQLSNLVASQFGVKISKTTINGYLASENWTYKRANNEDVTRNTDVIIDERFLYAQKMLQEGKRPEDPSRIIYWDVSYFETCIVARRARGKRGKPAVVPEGHRGVYFPMDDRERKKKRKRKETGGTDATAGITFSDEAPDNSKGGKANSLALCAAISGKEVLLAKTQFRHFSSEDATQFFRELLEKLNTLYPDQAFTFIGDNEGIYVKAMELFLDPKYRRHSLIPNPRYSPFLNAIEYLFNQLKAEVRGQQYKTLAELLRAVQRSFEGVQPAHLLNYHRTVTAYLLQCLKKEPIHSWRTKLGEDKEKVPEGAPKQKWDVSHQSVFMTEKKNLGNLIVKDNMKNPSR